MINLKDKKVFILCNLIFVVYGLHWFIPVHPALLRFLIGLITFIIPGFAWMSVLKDESDDIVDKVFKAVFLSALILMISLALYGLLKIKIDGPGHGLALALFTNAAFFLRAGGEGQPRLRPHKGALSYAAMAVIFVLLYASLYVFSLRSVPPLEDDDLELQGPAYGLAREFKPAFLTDRKTYYYFAHPPLIHFYAANFFILSGQLDSIKFYYDFSRSAQQLEDETLAIGRDVVLHSRDIGDIPYKIERVDPRGVTLNHSIRQGVEFDYNRYFPAGQSRISYDLLKKGRVWQLLRDEYRRFYQNPNIGITRSSNIFLSALTGALLFYVVSQLCHSLPLGLISVMLYFSFPSVLVLTTSEIYTSVSNFALLAMFWFYWKGDRKKRLNPTLSGVFAGLVNHKLFIFPLAIVAGGLLQKSRTPSGGKDRFVLPGNRIAAGFVLGTAVFWLYGILIDAKTFLTDHVHYHILDRILHKNALGYGGYPGLGELWRNFLSIPFLAVSVPLTLSFIIGGDAEDAPRRILPLWFLAGAAAFSLVDWKEITHLSLIILPLVISTMMCIARQKRPLRVLLIGVLMLIVADNAVFLDKALRDFSLILARLGWD